MMMPEPDGRATWPTIRPTDLTRRLLRESFPLFMGHLQTDDGRLLEVAPHHVAWCQLITDHPRLALLAPRDHSKTTVGLAFVLWLFFRHATDPDTALPLVGAPSTYTAVLFSATHDQARVLMTRFRELLGANAWLFPEPAGDALVGSRPPVIAESHIRLASGGELLTRAFGTSTRGLHPDFLLLDDVLNDQNSGSDAQREKTWHYFTSTLLPMHPERILIVGTAIHAVDLLHRLSPRSPAAIDGSVHDFTWRRYRAIDDETGAALWPGRHSYEELSRIRDFDASMFSREYQNDPRDDVATLFPHELTQPAVDAGAGLTLLPLYQPEPGEWVVLGADLALSERVGADFTVAIVAAYDPQTGGRRILTIRRERGLDFAAQMTLFTDLAMSYGVHIAVIEKNGFQRWLLEELQRQPGGGVFFGHTTTGPNRMRLEEDGIPILKLALLADRWIVPSGDARSRGTGTDLAGRARRVRLAREPL